MTQPVGFGPFSSERLFRHAASFLNSSDLAKAESISKFCRATINQDLTWKTIAQNLNVPIDKEKDLSVKEQLKNEHYEIFNDRMARAIHRTGTKTDLSKFVTDKPVETNQNLRNFLRSDRKLLAAVVEEFSRRGDDRRMYNNLIEDWIKDSPSPLVEAVDAYYSFVPDLLERGFKDSKCITTAISRWDKKLLKQLLDANIPVPEEALLLAVEIWGNEHLVKNEIPCVKKLLEKNVKVTDAAIQKAKELGKNDLVELLNQYRDHNQ